MPTFLAAGSFAVLTVTVVHELGYFSVVGLRFQAILSVSDYFANSILWLPLAAVAGLGGRVFDDLIVGPAPFKARDGSPNLKVIFFIFMGVFSVIAIIDREIGLVLLGALFVVTWLVRHLTTGKYVAAEMLKPALIISFIVPVLLAGAFILGILDARSDLVSATNSVNINEKGTMSENKVWLLRTLDRGVLVRDGDTNRIEFIRWEQIEKISEAPVVVPSFNERWPMCILFRSCAA